MFYAPIIEHHIDEEEHQLFPLSGRALTEQQKLDSVSRYEEAKAEAIAD